MGSDATAAPSQDGCPWMVQEEGPALRRLLVVFSCLTFLLVTTSRAEDVWVNVARDGLTDETLTSVSVLVSYGSYVYAATRSSVLEDPRIFRAPIRNDDAWEDVTDAIGWSEVQGHTVTDMQVVDDQLFVALDNGQLWRLDREGRWTALIGSGEASTDILALGSVERADTEAPMLCLAHGIIEVRCLFGELGEGGLLRTVFFRIPPDPSIGSARLLGVGQRLFLGLGGATRSDRICGVRSVAALDASILSLDLEDRNARWTSLTNDCFGTEQGFLGAMASFDERTYFGTGGGFGAMFRTTAGSGRLGYEEVTVFTEDDVTEFNPVADVNVLAVAGRRLYVGTRDVPVGSSGVDAGVWFVDDRIRWGRSNEPGFDEFGNLAVSAMASHFAYVYAGTRNASGFQIWRRTPSLGEILGVGVREVLLARRALARFDLCLALGVRCAGVLRAVIARSESIRGGFEGAHLPGEDAALIQAAFQRADGAVRLLGEAEKLAILADQAQSLPTARRLLVASKLQAHAAIHELHRTLIEVKQALPGKGGLTR